MKSVATEIDSTDSIPHKQTLTFVGLVNPSDGGGGIMTGRKWNFTASLAAWRCNGGPVVREPLMVVSSKIADSTLTRRMEQFPKWGIVKFTAKRSPRGTWHHPPIELVRFLGNPRDQSLQTVKKELQQPVVIDDRLFGAVNYDRETEWFESRKFIETEGIWITFSVSRVDDAKRLIQDAKLFWRERRKWFKKFKECVHVKTFDHCSGCYFDTHGTQLTETTFFNLLGNPCSVTFYRESEDLRFEIRGRSDELFGDHEIDVCGTLSRGLEE